jgi:hypothetical protein
MALHLLMCTQCNYENKVMKAFELWFRHASGIYTIHWSIMCLHRLVDHVIVRCTICWLTMNK